MYFNLLKFQREGHSPQSSHDPWAVGAEGILKPRWPARGQSCGVRSPTAEPAAGTSPTEAGLTFQPERQWHCPRQEEENVSSEGT